MNVETLIILAICVLLFGYLAMALLRPERF
jgi:K+-transporting ATPase KdpF subunit